MIAMQYVIGLPADYDMSIIDRRIADKGHMTDGLPGLKFKAYLSARKSDGARQNGYAPFYLWESVEGMNDFLCGPGFAALTQSFGWPVVKTWSVWHAVISEAIADARLARLEVVPIQPYTALPELRALEAQRAQAWVETEGALAAVVGFEPTTWNLVRFQLWKDTPLPSSSAESTLYEVGHISLGS